jgi:reverse gyrase
MKWYMHACPTCGGDLHDSEDRGWVECLLCARSVRASEMLKPRPVELVPTMAQRRQPEPLVAAEGTHERRAA